MKHGRSNSAASCSQLELEVASARSASASLMPPTSWLMNVYHRSVPIARMRKARCRRCSASATHTRSGACAPSIRW
eukprot:1513562-Prymnesium_polylepis.1